MFKFDFEFQNYFRFLSIYFRMSSTAQDEQENGALDASQPSTSTTRIETPILAEDIYVGGVAEQDLVNQVNAVIRCYLTRPNHQSPFQFVFDWTVNEEPNLNYFIELRIHEPPTQI